MQEHMDQQIVRCPCPDCDDILIGSLEELLDVNTEPDDSHESTSGQSPQTQGQGWQFQQGVVLTPREQHTLSVTGLDHSPEQTQYEVIGRLVDADSGNPQYHIKYQRDGQVHTQLKDAEKVHEIYEEVEPDSVKSHSKTSRTHTPQEGD